MGVVNLSIETKMAQATSSLVQLPKKNLKVVTRKKIPGVLDLEQFHAVMKSAELTLLGSSFAHFHRYTHFLDSKIVMLRTFCGSTA